MGRKKQPEPTICAKLNLSAAIFSISISFRYLLYPNELFWKKDSVFLACDANGKTGYNI
jgi:hypothetical protein